MRKKIKFAGLAAVIASFIAFPALAIDYGGIGAYPANPDPNDERTRSWFIYNLPGGTIKQDALIVQNSSDETMEAIIYAQYSVRSSDGGFALKQFADEKTALGSWVRLYDSMPEKLATSTPNIIDTCVREEADSEIFDKDISDWCQGVDYLDVSLPPNSTRVVLFTIAVPKSADVGEHTGGIAIQKKSPDQVNQQSGVSLTTRVGVRIYQTVPGEMIKDLTIASFTVTEIDRQGVLRASLGIRNSGNVSAEADIVLGITDSWFGSVNRSLERTVQVLRDDEAVVNFEIPRPTFGRLTFSPKVLYQDGSNTGLQVSGPGITLWVIPWLQIGLLLLGAGLLTGGVLIFIRFNRKAYDTSGWYDYTVATGDTITSLAKTAGVSWKILAKANKITSPYVVESGQKIKLPIKLTAKIARPSRKKSL